MHSRWSDGSGTIAEMADAAKERSYDYIAITDHSKGLKIAGGINERALRKQGLEIANINNLLLKVGAKLTVLHSIEMNLNLHGEGDMLPQSLSSLDMVLGSFHSSLRTIQDQTDRYLAALRQSKHPNPGASTRPHLQLSNRLERRLAARLRTSRRTR